MKSESLIRHLTTIQCMVSMNTHVYSECRRLCSEASKVFVSSTYQGEAQQDPVASGSRAPSGRKAERQGIVPSEEIQSVHSVLVLYVDFSSNKYQADQQHHLEKEHEVIPKTNLFHSKSPHTVIIIFHMFTSWISELLK